MKNEQLVRRINEVIDDLEGLKKVEAKSADKVTVMIARSALYREYDSLSQRLFETPLHIPGVKETIERVKNL